MNLTVTDFDPCILISKDPYCCIDVDDIRITGNPYVVNQCVEQLQANFRGNNVETSLLLGMQLEKTSEHIKIDQERYITEIFERFGLKNWNLVRTPIKVGSTLTKANDDEDLYNQRIYQSIVRLLMYPATATRPDIAYATHFLGQFLSKPTKTHLSAAKRVL